MTFYVDAWLDCPKPYVRIVNKTNQQVIADFSGKALSSAVEQGDICACDFYDSDDLSQLELVKSLLLLRCSQDICQEIQNINNQINRRTSQQAGMDPLSNVFHFPVRNRCVAGEC